MFLSVFIILLFTGYGYLFAKMLEKNGIDVGDLAISFISIFLSGIGLIFSVIWILMSKSSKAWYEVYENAISDFESVHHKILKLPSENIMGNMQPRKLNNSLFSTTAGAYSPSRINVAIGQICFLLWMCIMIFHIGCNIYLFSIETNENCYLKILTVAMPLLFLSVILFITKGKYLKSSFLEL